MFGLMFFLTFLGAVYFLVVWQFVLKLQPCQHTVDDSPFSSWNVRSMRPGVSSPLVSPGIHLSRCLSASGDFAKYHLLTLFIVLLSVHFLFAHLGYFFIFKVQFTYAFYFSAVVGLVAALGLFLAAWRGGSSPVWRVGAHCRALLLCGPRAPSPFSVRGLPGPGIKLVSAVLQGGFLTTRPQRSPCSLILVL